LESFTLQSLYSINEVLPIPQAPLLSHTKMFMFLLLGIIKSSVVDVSLSTVLLRDKGRIKGSQMEKFF